MARKFDLEAAKRGDPILLGADPVKFVAHLPEASLDQQLVVLTKGGSVLAMRETGTASFCTLTMAPRKQQLWVRAYQFRDGEEIYGAGGHHKDAKDLADERFTSDSVYKWRDPEPRLHGEYEVDDD